MRCLVRYPDETKNNKLHYLIAPFLLLVRSRLVRKDENVCLIDGNSCRMRAVPPVPKHSLVGNVKWKKITLQVTWIRAKRIKRRLKSAGFFTRRVFSFSDQHGHLELLHHGLQTRCCNCRPRRPCWCCQRQACCLPRRR